MNRLEPLRFRPDLRKKIWGTHDLRPFFGKVEHRVGEAWCLHDGSKVQQGPLQGRSVTSLVLDYGKRLMGLSWDLATHAVPASTRASFPILGKILFASGQLSIQVHPDDSRALQNDGSRGKTELWYVIDARPGAELGLGTTVRLDRSQLVEVSTDGSIDRHVHWVPAVKGQCVIVPAGTVHSARHGVLLCEIQQNSDVTYRFYDHGRKGLDGRPRPLQLNRAVKAADTGSRPLVTTPQISNNHPCRVARLGQCRQFGAELLSWDRPFLYSPDARRCHLLVFVRGMGSLNAVPFEAGDAFLVPAEAARFPVDGDRAQAVRAYVP